MPRLFRPSPLSSGKNFQIATGDDMKRIGFLLKVKQEMLEEYKKHHEAVWPEMLAVLSRHGWHNYSLF
ncbi:MAG: L-rhamnose mutarotase, partial [Anaerolineales bacterium]|nr:L-rhamnose mutarotase [Anaerolineales bacterium]